MKEGRVAPNRLKSQPLLSELVNNLDLKPTKAASGLDIDKFKENEAFILQSAKSTGIRNDPYKVSNAIVMEINFIAG